MEEGQLTEHVEECEYDRLLACCSAACASYVYVMRRRSWMVMYVVDMLTFELLPCGCCVIQFTV